MSRLHAVPVDALSTEAWANGAGTTTVIGSGPGASWSWRLSIADITQACDFSAYPDTRRQFVALDAPMQCRFQDGRERLLHRLQVMHFDGTDAPRVSLLEGPTRAFNLMLRGSANGELIARPLHGSMWLPTRPPCRWFVHMLAGHARLRVEDEYAEITAMSHTWIDAHPGERVGIEGGGELVLVQLTCD